MRRIVMALAAVLSLASMAGCGGGSASTSPPPTQVSVSVVPSQATVRVGSQLPFRATVQGSSNAGVTWQVNSVPGGTVSSGIIDSTGLYTAPSVPPSPPKITVTAVAMADATQSASASVTITIGVTVLPAGVSLLINTAQCPVSQLFTATVTGSSNSSVDWTLSGLPAGSPNTSFGSISTSGLYTPPDTIPSQPEFDVTATSVQDPTQSASASVSISAGGPVVDQASQSAPIEMGTSGGNANDKTSGSCCSGTLGALVTRNGTEFILSNNHVLARNDNAQPGESIVQPGLVDTQCTPGSVVATFSQSAKLQNSNGSAVVDAALAQVSPGNVVDASGAILQLGPVNCGLAQSAPPASTTVTPAVGMAVAKSGRSTGLTCGTISEVAANVQVHYSNACGSSAGFVVSFSNQVILESATFGNPGDSGSLIVKADTAEATALLFAGDQSTGVVIANPIQDVLAALADPSNQALPAVVGGSPHAVAACVDSSSSGQSRNASAAVAQPLEAEIARAKIVKSNHLATLMADPAVIGVGVGAGDKPGDAAIVVFLERGKPHEPLPAVLDGVLVKTRTIGPLRAFADESCRKEEDRSHAIPLPFKSLRRELAFVLRAGAAESQAAKTAKTRIHGGHRAEHIK